MIDFRAPRARRLPASLTLLAATLAATACQDTGSAKEPAAAASKPQAKPVAAAPAAAVKKRPNTLPLDRIELPKGFVIEEYATGVKHARSMARSDKGTLFVGTRRFDKVYALVDSDGDGFAETHHVIDEGMNTPNGIAYRDGALYVAEINRVLRYDAIDQHLTDSPEPKVLVDGLPSDEHHGWKYLRFSPEGELFFAIGAPCNVCERKDPRYASILHMKLNGGGKPEVYASGVRNSVGFDFHPQTGELWFTDNGRDMLGDDLPPDELNHAPRAGLHFGFPYCHGVALPDPEHHSEKPCTSYRPPAQPLGAHVAGLGMRFYTGKQFPPEYQGDIFIAQHGSWNRSKKAGYRVMRVHLNGEKVASYTEFATGWLGADESVWGRPVDLLQTPEGALLLSDDHAGAVYRIRYVGS